MGQLTIGTCPTTSFITNGSPSKNPFSLEVVIHFPPLAAFWCKGASKDSHYIHLIKKTIQTTYKLFSYQDFYLISTALGPFYFYSGLVYHLFVLVLNFVALDLYSFGLQVVSSLQNRHPHLLNDHFLDSDRLIFDVCLLIFVLLSVFLLKWW